MSRRRPTWRAAAVLAGAFLAAGALAADGPPRPQRSGPWLCDLLIATSRDGQNFEKSETFVVGGGVPSLIRDARGRLLAAFQWFPYDDPHHFDRVAVKTSDDGGRTWSAPRPIAVEGMPEGYQRPFDPTLALCEDGRVRLYFSSHAGWRPGQAAQPATYSAISTDGVRYRFEPGVRFAVAGRPVIDCAVVRLGRTWHYCAPVGRPEEGAYHAVSQDGLEFVRRPDIPSAGGVNWLGNLMPSGDGMRFYGCSRQGIWWSFSKDGNQWTAPSYTGLEGVDPAVVETAEGRYLAVFVSRPRDRPEPPFLLRDGPAEPRPGPPHGPVADAAGRGGDLKLQKPR